MFPIPTRASWRWNNSPWPWSLTPPYTIHQQVLQPPAPKSPLPPLPPPCSSHHSLLPGPWPQPPQWGLCLHWSPPKFSSTRELLERFQQNINEQITWLLASSLVEIPVCENCCVELAGRSCLFHFALLSWARIDRRGFLLIWGVVSGRKPGCSWLQCSWALFSFCFVQIT